MNKNDIFEKNEKRLVKKATVFGLAITLIAVSLIPFVSSCAPEPEIEITKTGPIFGYVGDEITYTYNVSNIGDVSLSSVNVSDDRSGLASYVSGDENENDELDTDEIWIFTSTYTPSFTFPNPLVNTATASGVGYGQTVEDIDDYTLYPFILRKGVLLYWEGENIDYNDPDTQFTINMLKDGEVLDTFTISESSIKRLWLSEGTYQFCEIDLPDGYESAYGCISHTTGQDYPDFTHLNVITFDLAIEKSGLEHCFPGDNITYYYQVTNDGPASVTPIVEDDICGTPIFTGGDTDDDGLIDPDETWTYECNYTVVEEPGSLINNTANVTDAEGAGRPLDQWWLGGDRDLGNNVDEWSVEVICSDQEDEYTLTVIYEGDGTVAKDPDQLTYTDGTVVELTAIAGSGWTFDHWGSDLTGSENPENITMDDNKTVIANFTEIEDDDEEDDEDDDDSNPTTVTTTSSSNSYAGNSPPVANTSGPYYGVIDEEIEFDGSKSYDLNGIITHYGWSFGDGSTGFSEVMPHIYSNGGSYLVTLMVIDDDGISDTDKTIAFISVPNRPPSIPKILGPPTGNKDTKYSYATGSTDLDNDGINYIIDWGDGSTDESGFLPSGHYFSILHSWAEPGEYNITVTASDDQSTTSSEMTVLIEENIVMDNIAIVILGILVLIALLIVWMYSKKGKKN